MANNAINANGSVTLGDPSSMVGNFNLSVSIPMTGSNLILDAPTIISGSWQPLKTGSLQNVRYGFFSNQGTSSILIAYTNNGTPVLILQPNDDAVMSFSSSATVTQQLWAQSSAGSLLQYGLAES